MDQPIIAYRAILSELIAEWREAGLPGRQGLEDAAFKLMEWKDKAGISGIWADDPPLLVTATLDDGFGHGLQLIHLFAAAIGMPTHFVGLQQEPDVVLEACNLFKAEWLGLTVLQFDTDDAVRKIADGLNRHTRIIAGGPVFRSENGFAGQIGIDVVAADVSDFIHFFLTDASLS